MHRRAASPSPPPPPPQSINQLRAALAQLGLPTGGKKAVLQARLATSPRSLGRPQLIRRVTSDPNIYPLTEPVDEQGTIQPHLPPGEGEGEGEGEGDMHDSGLPASVSSTSDAKQLALRLTDPNHPVAMGLYPTVTSQYISITLYHIF